jgi:very-short-patch-repair endonuclease
VVHRALPLVGLQPARGGVDSPEWAIAHAVLCQGRRDAVATLDSAMYRRVVTRRRLETVLGQLPRRYCDLLLLCNPRAESGLETHLRLLLRSAGIDVRVQVKISGVGRVDLLVGERLVIETDGREWRSDKDSFAKDERRDLALAEQGYLVLRLSYQQVLFEPERVLDVVRGIVRRGEHRWSGRHRRAGLVRL